MRVGPHEIERGPWEEVGRCADCGHVARRKPNGDNFGGYRDVCPHCGSHHTGKTVARRIRTVSFEPRVLWFARRVVSSEWQLRTDYLAAMALTGGNGDE